MVKELVVATSNQGKLREIRALLEPLGIRVVSAREAGFKGDIEEVGESFEENARLKAETVARALGKPALADDSGLEVDALGGAPGVRSARYAGEGATDEANNRKLLEALRGLPPEQRGARFVCVMCLVTPQGRCITARGELAGRIALEPRGEGGFGYDPVFELPELGVSVAEISPEEKNRISHRARALQSLASQLKDFLETGA